MPSNTRSLICRLQYGDLTVTLTAEGASWNPDVADDLARRCLDLWNGTLDAMDSFEMLDNGGPHDDDEDEIPTPNKELQTPHIVRFMEQWGEEDA